MRMSIHKVITLIGYVLSVVMMIGAAVLVFTTKDYLNLSAYDLLLFSLLLVIDFNVLRILDRKAK